MAINSSAGPPVSWDDVLAAINPPQATPEELYERALDAIVADWQEGHITEGEADEMIRELMAARVGYEIRKMINYAFSPNDAGRRSGNATRRGFSLL